MAEVLVDSVVWRQAGVRWRNARCKVAGQHGVHEVKVYESVQVGIEIKDHAMDRIDLQFAAKELGRNTADPESWG